MAFNGITMSAIADELNKNILGGKVQKIAQPENYGLIFTIHTDGGKKLLYISANASLPLIYFTEENKPSPALAFNFVMVLRKHIGNAKIIGIKQFGLERIIRIEFEHLDEMKDVATKYLYIEIMNKYSNIIFTDKDDNIIDAIKHVSAALSSVREVLPGRKYFMTTQTDRLSLFDCDYDTVVNKVLMKQTTVKKALSSSFIGFSAITALELANRCGLSEDTPLSSLHESEIDLLAKEIISLKNNIQRGSFNPTIIFDDKNRSLEFSAFNLSLYEGCTHKNYTSISRTIEEYYKKRNADNLIKQKSTDLKKIISNHIDRANKKLAIQEKQLEDTSKMEKLRLYGELLFAYGHSIDIGNKDAKVTNYYDNSEIVIPLDPTLNGIDNSKKYFKKYDKYKRTAVALKPQIENTLYQLDVLASIMSALEIAENEGDLENIRQELALYGFIKKNKNPKDKKSNKQKKNPPLHFKTPEGFDLYVGKNNIQNEEVTFKIAKNNDWWFHIKTIPGGHVVLKDDGREIPDEVFEMAAGLAAYYSTASKHDIVEVDYLKRKEIKRPPHGGAGFVIYHTNYSINVVANISKLTLIK